MILKILNQINFNKILEQNSNKIAKKFNGNCTSKVNWQCEYDKNTLFIEYLPYIFIQQTFFFSLRAAFR